MGQQPETAGIRTPAEFMAARADLLAREGLPSGARRLALSGLSDQWLAALFEAAGGDQQEAALVAVGGYGRREVSAGSDLDVLLLHHDGESAALADGIWYPIWDARLKLDHSVRTVSEARRVAAQDLRVVLGLLDARTVAGNDALRQRLVVSVLADWRGLAAKRVGQLREMVDERIARDGELPYLLEPDVKEAYGGLRDITILRALAATWLTDQQHAGIEEPRRLLLDARDGLHQVLLARGARMSDRLLMQEQDAVAERLGAEDGLDLMRRISAAGRIITYASDTTWHRVLRQTRTPRGLRRLRPGRPAPSRRPLANGVVEQDGEVVLAVEARPSRDPVLVLRAAAAAAQSGLPLSPHTLTRLAEESAPMPVPWPRAARDALAGLLGAGRPAVPVWESLDQIGLIERLIPMWGPVRSAPQRNAVHRFTVDRHLVEAAVEAARYQREVPRPDLLLVAALLHDIGKGRPEVDHSVLGAELVAIIAPELGFEPLDCEVLVRLTRHHLLLAEAATRRDLEDPATTRAVAGAVQDTATLDLLLYLTRADAAATGPAAWSAWKASLVDGLARRTRALLAGEPVPPPQGPGPAHQDLLAGEDVEVAVDQVAGGLEVAVAANDRPGLLSLVAGTLAMHRLDVRTASTATYGRRALLVWGVESAFGEPPPVPRLLSDLRRAVAGSIDVDAALARREEHLRAAAPDLDGCGNRVDIVPHASSAATVVEVRASDRPGTLYRLTAALTAAGVDIASAHIESRGAGVVDTFYVTGAAGGPLSVQEQERVAADLRTALD
jgi:[protein-PII] uridylyltransferase